MSRPFPGAFLATCIALAMTATAQTPRQPSISQDDLRTWLTYIASNELQGRLVFTEGLGLAGAYIASHLKEWGVKPGGDRGSYFQDVRVLGMRTRSSSSVTVTVNGQSRTFGRRRRHVPAQSGREADGRRRGGVRRLRRHICAAAA